MNQFVRNFILGFGLFLVSGVIKSTQGQSVFDPNDPIVIYNPANPPVEPPFGQVGKWVKRNRLGWNTSSFKAYIYKGVQFRLKWPKNYDASGNTKYPLLVFFHGRGEWGNKYDNEYQLYHGGQKHSTAVDNGSFNGFLLYPQASALSGPWSMEETQYVMELVQQFLIPEVNVDPFRISVNGLSAGGLRCWTALEQYPKLVAGCVPMSNAASSFAPLVTANKFTPIWLFQGGKDTDPKPEYSRALKASADNVGANFAYTEYPNLGHAVWDATWAEPDYFPFLMRANKTNPWPLYGQTEFCNNGPGSINTTIGVSAGFTQYQWQRNGTIIPGEIQNTLTVTDTGTYSCRIKDGANWSYWSPIPVQIKYKTGTVPPTIKMTELQSYVLPSPDGNTTINLEVPAGYINYKWEKVGSTSSISVSNVLNGVGPGSYKVRVTEQAGCAGAYSDPFTVIDANGPNKPDPAINLLASPLSFTSMKLNWSSNPSAPYPATHFEIYEATRSGGPYKFVSLVDGGIFSFVREGLKPGTKYYYVIRAINNTAASPVSNEAYATTQKDVSPPTAPQNLRVTGTSRNYVAIAWDESIDDIGVDHYEIFVNGVLSHTTSAKEYTVYGLNYGSSYNFTVKAVDLAGNKSAPSNQVTTQALNKGLNFKHYIGTWDNLPDFDLLTPISTGVVPNVTLANTTQAENYAFLWEGYIRIPSTGNYTFRTRSDDGSKLYLNTTYGYTKPALVDNDGLHSAQNKDASIYLTAGV
ncbi:MAG: fibronectin type III domain-containing protein, partial [Chitinophagaceae bacterium]|nr:fibronectin type III domain-containing protein [Chitinophagaceae bacterium]